MSENQPTLSLFRAVDESLGQWGSALKEAAQSELHISSEECDMLLKPAEQPRMTLLSGKQLSAYHRSMALYPDEHELLVLASKIHIALPPIANQRIRSIDMLPALVEGAQNERTPEGAFLWIGGCAVAAIERSKIEGALAQEYSNTSGNKLSIKSRQKYRYITIGRAKNREQINQLRHIATLFSHDDSLVLPKKYDLLPVDFEIKTDN